jgi:hypothetical protein
LLSGTGHVQIRADHRGASESGKDAAFLRGLAGDRLTDGGPQARCLRPVLSKTARKRSDKVAVAIAAQDLKAGKPALTEARSIFLNGALL